MIEVLWIDDQWEDQKDFIGYAEQSDINIHPIDNSVDGIAMLKANRSKYHAVILDAKVKLKKDSLDTNLEGLKNSRDYLIELNVNSYLPFYIFTGQPDYVDSELFEQSFGEFFIKGDGNQKLLESIIRDASKQREMQARALFSDAFKIFDYEILESEHMHLLIDIIFCFKEKDFRKKNIPVIRDLFEATLKRLNTYGVIPSDLFYKDKRPNLAYCVRFLEGYNTEAHNGREYKFDKVIPAGMKANLRKLKESTSEYSHLKENEIAKYEFLSNAFCILELLVFLPKFIKKEYLD